MTNRAPEPAESHSDAEWEALARYLAGECAPAEAGEVERWIASTPERRVMVAALGGALDRVAPPPVADVDVERALARTRSRLDDGTVRSIGSARSTARRRWAPALRAAAALVVVAGGTVVFWSTRLRAPTNVAFTYTTGVGARDSVRLADGSLVVLGPQSRLQVPERFARDGRTVTLDGEGWFDVVHDEAHPFTVRAAGAVIRDVGTTFTVRSDAGGAVRVAVSSGSVAVTPAGRPDGAAMVLAAGDRATLPAASSAAPRRGALAVEDTAWRSGRLVFRDAPLSEVQRELRRWYGLELRIADSALATRHLTASLGDLSADGVVDVLALSLGATAERTGDTVLVRPR